MLLRGLISIPRVTIVLICLHVGRNDFCCRSRQMSSPGWAPSCYGYFQWETFSLLLCLLGGLRGLAQPGAPWLRRGVDHCHKSAGGNPHLPVAGCAALEGESGHRSQVPVACPPVDAQPSCLARVRASWKRIPVGTFMVQVQQRDGSVSFRW